MEERSLVELETREYEKSHAFHEGKMMQCKEKIRANNTLVLQSNANMSTCWSEGLQKAQKLIANFRKIEDDVFKASQDNDDLRPFKIRSIVA